MPDGGRIGLFPGWWLKKLPTNNNFLQNLGRNCFGCVSSFFHYICRLPSGSRPSNLSGVQTVSNDQVLKTFISKPSLRSESVLTHNKCLAHAQCHAHCSHDYVNEEYEYYSIGSWLNFAHRSSLNPCSACQVAQTHVHYTSNITVCALLIL
jgi:hypothetical protein